MINYNSQIYKVRDQSFEKECKIIIDQLYTLYLTNSFFSYHQSADTINRLSLILSKNNENYIRFYKDTSIRFSALKERVSWDLIEPLTNFERDIKMLTDEIQDLLGAQDYNQNGKAKEKINFLDNLLREYGKKTKMPDYLTRCRFFNSINEVKKIINTNSLISYRSAPGKLYGIEKIISENLKKYVKEYLPYTKKLDAIKASFDKSKTYFTIKDAKVIKEQIDKSEKLIYNDSYDDITIASDLLTEIDSKLFNIQSIKKTKIEESINSQLEALRKFIWKEDWEDINNAVKVMISEAENSGQLYKLNLDKFNIENKKREKKEQIFELIRNEESKKNFRSAEIVEKARNLLSVETSRKELEELLKATSQQDRSKEKQITMGKRPYSKILKYSFYIIFLFTALTIFIINHYKNNEHFETKGNRYADIIETIVYAQLKSSNEVDIESIRKKPILQNNELKIISIDNSEVVIEYRNKIYKKNIRKK